RRGRCPWWVSATGTWSPHEKGRVGSPRGADTGHRATGGSVGEDVGSQVGWGNVLRECGEWFSSDIWNGKTPASERQSGGVVCCACPMYFSSRRQCYWSHLQRFPVAPVALSTRATTAEQVVPKVVRRLRTHGMRSRYASRCDRPRNRCGSLQRTLPHRPRSRAPRDPCPPTAESNAPSATEMNPVALAGP